MFKHQTKWREPAHAARRPGRQPARPRTLSASSAPVSRLRFLYRLAPAAGLLLVSGCFATLEQNLDILLSPGALDNTLVAPYTVPLRLLEFFIRFVNG